MEQFEQLLTCAICLDRYRNPKLLPCQHSFCMEPCLEGLVDYVRRQVKCPECRAEHRIPYQGIQGFPTNVTLQRFLELHIEITGELPDPTSGQVMERCNVCSEKAYCNFCHHCDKKVCEECKGAHMEILRREISRINNQIRRGIHRLQDSLSLVEKNTQNIQTNCLSVSEEIEEIYRRLNKALKDRTEYLRGEIDRYMGTEMRTLTGLKENLEQEVANILSNCDLADKHMNENVDIWDDCELMDAKEIFLKTVEFIRNFEYENTDYSRKIRLILAHDPNQLVLHVAGYGDLNIANSNSPFSQGTSTGGLLQPPGPGLMRSKSDHRLAFRNQEPIYGEQEEQVLSGRKFGERRQQKGDSHSDRYGYRGGDEDYDREVPTRSKYSSRFRRRNTMAEDDSDNETARNVRFHDQQQKTHERERPLDTEDVTRGPLSGITRLADSPRVMKKLQENPTGKKEKKPEAAPQPKPPQVTAPKRAPATRQVSEEDEISRIKKQNKGATTSAEQVTESRPSSDRATVEERHPPARKTPSAAPEAPPSSAEDSEETPNQKKTLTAAATRRPSSEAAHKKTARSPSSDSSSSAESSSSSAVRSTGAPFTTEEVKQKYLAKSDHVAAPQKTFQSRFLNKPATVPPPKQEEEEEEEESETSSEEESETEEESDEPSSKSKMDDAKMAKSDIGALLARSAHARDAQTDNFRKKEDSPVNRSRYSSSADDHANRYGRRRTTTTSEDDPPRYGYTSRFLNKSKSSAAIAHDDEDHSPRYTTTTTSTTTTNDEDSKYPTSRSRYMALKDRRQRLARSRSSQQFGDEEEADDTTSPISPTTSNPSAYLASRGYGTASAHDLARSRSSHALKSRDNSPEKTGGGGGAASEKDGAALSSWARYLKNKYGNRSGGGAKEKEGGGGGGASGGASSSSTAAARRLSLGLPLRSSTELASSDDDSKNMRGSPTTPTTATAAGIAAAAAGTFPRSQYLQKCQQLFQIGGRGSEAGCFTWPRGVAVGPDNTIIVADSSNHRVQVFDSRGRFLKEFGQYGSGEGEFDCLAGVAVNRIGQFIIADRYNHRIQVFDPSGRFLRTFGSQGTADGRFNYPWGIATDALGFIYVCDKENHRIQVFQSDGTFVGKFGTMGSKEGQLEHPHYIAVSNTNKVIVSDSNNHRIQIFDINGKVISSFGVEGSEEGEFKFPRGVAVDDQGYICVADSGNNRIQIFHPDGKFLRALGCWGTQKGEFKGLEGVAMTPDGHILVCDRENHRIQVF
ncbi:RING finger protein nhl-1 [Anthonomus grandis grandis]|uniref:RING finger protein nhl-1 n=1 Tax=Anthonomus grandis grandis TaxID=2921223 RepID=UPI0021650C07|nr:RING finger protein nhl-1 [Anthonomus grandis grandis]XP_050310143.1 RING finger protein nhl-1 [Anthonomus grandis grandis]